MTNPTTSKIQQFEVEKIRALILKEAGIAIEPAKDYIIRSRLESRMETTGLNSFTNYYHFLLFGENNELQKFIESVTINETYFFRDFPQLQGFAEEVLPPYVDEKRKKNARSLRVWSAACSIGCEPYTISIILQEMIDDFDQWKISIEATDINAKVLRHARLGLYDQRAVKDVPTQYLKNHFRETSTGWRVNPNVSKCVSFQQANLIDRKSLRQMQGFDFIFCRNVLIYFNDEFRKLVVNAFYDALVPGGFVFLGSSESVGRISAAFQLVKIGNFLCYKKPPNA